MAELIKQAVPPAEIAGVEGRQASFEVQVNGQLVYSKLQTLAFPDFHEVTSMVKDVYDGNPIKKIVGQQPIECVIF